MEEFNQVNCLFKHIGVVPLTCNTKQRSDMPTLFMLFMNIRCNLKSPKSSYFIQITLKLILLPFMIINYIWTGYLTMIAYMIICTLREVLFLLIRMLLVVCGRTIWRRSSGLVQVPCCCSRWWRYWCYTVCFHIERYCIQIQVSC